MNPLELASYGPVIPVIVIDRLEDAVPMAKALVAGGVRVLEVTLRTAAGLPAIEAIAREVPDAEWAARLPAERSQALAEAHGAGFGRNLFAGMRRNVVTAEEGACTWV